MRLFNIYILLILSSLNIWAQDYKYNNQQKQILKEADEEYSYNNYSIALPLYKQIFEVDSLNKDLNFKIGECIFFSKRNKLESLPYFERAKNKYIDSYFYLGRLYRLQKKFNKSLEAFNIYKNSNEKKSHKLTEVDFYLNKTINAKSMTSEPSDFIVKNIGNKINTPYPEYGPLITSDENIIYFTSRRPDNVNKQKDPNGDYFEDIFIAKNENGKWNNAKNAGKVLNTPLHDATVTLTNDNKTLYIYRTNKELTGGDIYKTEIVDNTFSVPDIIKGGEINSKNGAESSACIAPDQKTFYFSSNREGGYGGKDIYKVVKLPNNKWSKAINLGAAINTPYDEDAPFIQADGITLYFSSKGHQNMGGYDIFVSKLDDKGNWSFPQNLGTPVNSVADDIFFVTNPEETAGYFSSNRLGGYGESDIYKVKFPDKYVDNLILKGRVIDDSTFVPLKATITIVDYGTKELQGIYRTNYKTGKFIMVLLPKRHYKLIVESEGYKNLVDDIDMTQRLRIKDLFKSIKLRKDE